MCLHEVLRLRLSRAFRKHTNSTKRLVKVLIQNLIPHFTSVIFSPNRACIVLQWTEKTSEEILEV